MSVLVLAIDNNEDNLTRLKAHIRAIHCQVLTAQEGDEAFLALCAQARDVDVILYNLPSAEKEGWAFLEKLKSSVAWSHIPTILTSEQRAFETLKEDILSCVDNVITTPFNADVLKARIHNLARLKREYDELKHHEKLVHNIGLLPTLWSGLEKNPPQKKVRALTLSDDLEECTQLYAILEPYLHLESVQTISDFKKHIHNTSHTYDIFIVNLHLKEEDGLHFCGALRRSLPTRHTPLIALLNEESGEAVANAFDMGASDYLVRPLRAYEVIPRCLTQVRRHRCQRHVREVFSRTLDAGVRDALTGLYNARYFAARLDATLEDLSAQNISRAALLSLDIDRFKNINDTHGHPTGDLLLKAFCERIKENIRADSAFCRQGGDEFFLLLPHASAREALALATRLCQRVREKPFCVNCRSLSLTLSIGVAEINTNDATKEILEGVDMALYAAKSRGRNGAAFLARSSLKRVKNQSSNQPTDKQALALNL